MQGDCTTLKFGLIKPKKWNWRQMFSFKIQIINDGYIFQSNFSHENYSKVSRTWNARNSHASDFITFSRNNLESYSACEYMLI